MTHIPWPVVVEVHEAGMVTTEAQIRCGCTCALEHDWGHEAKEES